MKHLPRQYKQWLMLIAIFYTLFVIGGLFLAPVVRLKALSVLTAALSLFLMGMSLDEIRRPTSAGTMTRVWLPMAGGVGCVSAALWVMAQSWEMPTATKPIALVVWLLGSGTILLVASCITITNAVRKTGRMQGGASSGVY